MAQTIADPASAGRFLGAFWNAYVTLGGSRGSPGFLQSLFEGRPDFRPPDPVSVAKSSASSWDDVWSAVVAAGDASARTRAAIAGLRGLAAISPSEAMELAFHWSCGHELLLGENRASAGRTALLLTEPRTESDLQALETVATKEGTGWVLNGRKEFVCGVGAAEVFICVAIDAGSRAVSLFAVPKSAAGIVIEPMGRFGGGVELHAVTLNSVVVGSDALIGQTGHGYVPLQQAFDRLRLAISALALGSAEEIASQAFEFVRGRKQFGKGLIESDGVREKIAGISERMHAIESALAFGVAAGAGGAEATNSAVKIAATELALEVSEDAMELLGARGVVEEKLLMHAAFLRALCSAGGPNDVLRLFLSMTAGRGLLQYLIDAEKAKGRLSTAIDASLRLTLRRMRGRFARRRARVANRELRDAARTLAEIAGILGERAYLVFDFYRNDAVWHSYELNRLADIALEAFLLWASICRAETAGEEASVFVRHRASRAWYRAVASSRELMMGDLETDVRTIVERRGFSVEPRRENHDIGS